MSEIPGAKLLYVLVKNLEKNPDNPRRLFDPDDMKDLEKSIRQRGILVPLIVFRKQEGIDKFVLLDGDRRFRCAKRIGLKEVPANEIKKPDRKENIIRMFNIHRVRVGWELVPTAYALETLINLLEKEGGKTTDTELSKLTGMRPIRIAECKRILKYKKYLYLSLDTNPEKRIGGDFFSQLDLVFDKLKKYPEILDTYPKSKLIQIMINKKQDGTIVNLIQDFRILKRILMADTKGIQRKRIIENVKEFIRSEPSKEKDTSGKPKSKAMTVDELYNKTAYSIYTERDIIKTAKTLTNLLTLINYAEVQDKDTFNRTLERVLVVIQNILDKKRA
jgi:ParB family chromosome partitioning protein